MSLTAEADGPVTLETVRHIMRELPGVEEGTSYGTPAFRVRRKLLARMHDSGEALVLRIDSAQREALTTTDPVTFYVTPHYEQYPYVLVRLSTSSKTELTSLIRRAWRAEAPKLFIEAYDHRSGAE